VCFVLILLGREKSKRKCVCCIDIIGEREEQERECVCFVLILLGREKSKRECVCCIDIIGERKEQERVCVLYWYYWGERKARGRTIGKREEFVSERARARGRVRRLVLECCFVLLTRG